MSDLPPSSYFNVSLSDGIAHVEMNNPDMANSMTSAFWEDLPVIAAALDADPGVRVMVLSGRGKHFTSGMDLAAFEGILQLTREEPGRAAYALRNLVLKLQRSLNSLETARVPVIAAIHGACLGGGVDLISACDIRIASADASFGIEEIHIGMAADVGTLQRLPKLMAPGVVRELAYTGRRFSAEEAMGWGVVNAVHSGREATIFAAMEMARDIAAKSPLAIAGIKKALTYARDHTVADGLDQIATWNGGMLRPEDLMKAIQTKMESQQAVFDDLPADAG
ncbi:crotonase/enoyl-CoA hydratase family protein [Primorskyibacter aestuariivivens]|uniref:crotonase/enoyl-CoA hydratase family protein n=1 Tax=Primorskyibacter aestuariivivens TaxID=1888912 RepID=UPI002301C827|nr:crotonase/enoyl-CoA hydratase family protein [Primorskyibacter aestuariivivens]MDA7428785.1 crotonase/enoyl-CoA hydratase family protein [Primorskyibacter aestuariivivens]